MPIGRYGEPDVHAGCETAAMILGIRAARAGDSSTLSAIERRSGERFREVGLDDIAEDEPTAPEVLTRYAIEGRSWVAVDDEDRPVGFVVVDDID